jgi:hypothetical protein
MIKNSQPSLALVEHTFNSSTWEAVAGKFLSSRPAWSTECVSGQPELYRETLSQKKKKKKKKKEKKKERKNAQPIPKHNKINIQHTSSQYQTKWRET